MKDLEGRVAVGLLRRVVAGLLRRSWWVRCDTRGGSLATVSMRISRRLDR